MKLPKIRKFWKINPWSRVKRSGKVYTRRKAKDEKRRIEKEEGVSRNV